MVNLILATVYSLLFYRPPEINQDEIQRIKDTSLFWIFFTDKGFRTEEEYQLINSKLSAQNSKIKDFYDLPVNKNYTDIISEMGGELRRTSNWLNAASFRLHPELVPIIATLPFVHKIKPLGIFTEELPAVTQIKKTGKVRRQVHALPPEMSPAAEDTSEYRKFYGPAFEQNYMLGVPQVYFKGYNGSRVRLAILDTGLKRKHRALEHLNKKKEKEIVKEHDFLSGDDFYFTRIPNSSQKILENQLRIKEPYFAKAPRPLKNLPLFYIADTVKGIDPVRAVFVSFINTEQGSATKPTCLSYSLPESSYRHPVAITDSPYTYLIWQAALASSEKSPKLYFSRFTDTIFEGASLLEERGAAPDLFLKDDTLYLTFTLWDSILMFRKGAITQQGVNWLESEIIAVLREKLVKPQIILDSLNEIELFATGLKSLRIYHYNSRDKILFEPKPNPDTLASGTVTAVFGNRIYLVYQDHSVRPLSRIVCKSSTDGGNTWSEKAIVSNQFPIGDISFLAGDFLNIAYESQGSIFLYQSSDNGLNWTKIFEDTSEFLYNPRLGKSEDGRTVLIYSKRGDENTDYEAGEDHFQQQDHGTRMVSIIAGYQPGNLVGVAPWVELLIAKTEMVKERRGRYYEYTLEEDTYIEGLEWAERNGAQVISSSLGYRGWYDDKDFDGKTAPISIACRLAAERGVVIVTAMGNRRADSLYYPWPKPYIVAPADAFGVISAGGVHKNRRPWTGSGTGPTIDKRIKPELVAMSDTVIVVTPDSTDGLDGSAGTSAATALIAGCAALLLSAHPDWDADSVKHALFNTASDNTPGIDTVIDGDTINIFGYGIPNVDSALKIYPPKILGYQKDQLGDPFPNPFILNQGERIYFPLLLIQRVPRAELRIYSLNGELVKTKELEKMIRGGRIEDIEKLEEIGAYWDGKNEKGNLVATGIYFVLLRTTYGKAVKKFAVVR